MENKEFWVARDRDGDLYLYSSKPELAVNFGKFWSVDFWELPNELFPSLTFENGPKKVFTTSYGRFGYDV